MSDPCTAGYSFFDSGDIELLGHRKKSPYANIGEYHVAQPSNLDTEGSYRQNSAAGGILSACCNFLRHFVCVPVYIGLYRKCRL